MIRLSRILLLAFVIVIVKQDDVSAYEIDSVIDQVAEESRNKNVAVTIIDPPRNLSEPVSPEQIKNLKQPQPPEQRPPSKPPNIPNPEKQGKVLKYVEVPRQYYGPVIQKVPPRPPAQQGTNHPGPNHHSPNHPGPNNQHPTYKYTQVIPLKKPGPYYHHPNYPRQQLVFAASTGKPFIITAKSPKFSLPIQTINGIRVELRPPKFNQTSTTTTTTTPKPVRNKRIWPKHILEKKNKNSTATNDPEPTLSENKTVAKNLTSSDEIVDNYVTAGSNLRTRFGYRDSTTSTQPSVSSTRIYRRVTRVPKHKPTPTPLANLTMEQNDWVPIVPSHYQPIKRPNSSNNRRSDVFLESNSTVPMERKRTLYLQSYGLIPVKMGKKLKNSKRVQFFRKRRHLNPHGSSGRVRYFNDLDADESHSNAKVVTKVKHHHHHHHHKYIKTVEKKVPVKVPFPKPYPVTVERKVPVPYPVEKLVPQYVEKRVPYPVPVDRKVPYPVPVKVPHPVPVPVKVVEKEYVAKPYPVIHHVPVVKHVPVKVPQPVPYPIDRKVPYPVQVAVDRPVAVPYTVEKQVPYPVPVKVFVPQPYPVERKVPYPVEVMVKEPVEIIKEVPVRVPVPQPFAVKVPHPVPVTVEKKVPYPIEVEKKVPVPFYVQKRVEVEKKVPVYIPKPYAVEKQVPVPVKVPYPVKVPVKVPYEVPVEVPVGVPVYLEYNTPGSLEKDVFAGLTVSDEGVTSLPSHTVTVHGNTGFTGFSSRSDDDTTATPSPTSAMSIENQV